MLTGYEEYSRFRNDGMSSKVQGIGSLPPVLFGTEESTKVDDRYRRESREFGLFVGNVSFCVSLGSRTSWSRRRQVRRVFARVLTLRSAFTAIMEDGWRQISISSDSQDVF